MIVSLLAYSIVNFMRTRCFTKETNISQFSTIRLLLFKVAGTGGKTLDLLVLLYN